jgi:hypothetical protein
MKVIFDEGDWIRYIGGRQRALDGRLQLGAVGREREFHFDQVAAVMTEFEWRLTNLKMVVVA